MCWCYINLIIFFNLYFVVRILSIVIIDLFDDYIRYFDDGVREIDEKVVGV